MIPSLISFAFSLGLTFGIGSSTFALIFYIQALQDGTIDASERAFLHTVYAVLRIGIVLLGVGLIASLFFLTPTPLVFGSVAKPLVLLAIIIGNAVLMSFHKMPMRFGPILAGGSWYALLLITKSPLGLIEGWSALLVYALFLSLFYALFTAVKDHFAFTTTPPAVPSSTTPEVLAQFATDASAFRVLPKKVFFARNARDVVEVVKLVAKEKKIDPTASLTVRAGGTCMDGGALNTGTILDMTKYMSAISIDPKAMTATVEMGAYFRDIEDEAKKHGLMFASYPSSRRICGIGGMIGNNASGEKSLRNGPTSKNVISLEIVLADGTVEQVGATSAAALTNPRHKVLKALAERWTAPLKKASGFVKKAASGYRLDKILRGDTFNLVPLFVGAQGTLGIVTKAVLRLTPIPAYTELVVISGDKLEDIPHIINTVLTHNPEGLETFDDNTFLKAVEFLPAYAKRAKQYIKDDAHLVILAQFSEETKEMTHARAIECYEELTKAGYAARHVTVLEDVEALWHIRRNAFTLMRDYNQKGFKAVPCIEDIIVPVASLGKLIPRLHDILERRKISYGYHGHIGDGSLRIIPVFDFSSHTLAEDIISLTRETFALVKECDGNMSADHSDGIIRTPFLKEFYGDEIAGVFEQIKNIYDPENIFNPGKKVGGTVQDIAKHLSTT